MKVSIITVCYNSAKTLENTLQSVLSQSYKDIEYILVDGGSTDNTLAIIQRYESQLAKWISEKDRGMYDALNKGVKLASGDIVGILNSDDFYVSADVIAKVVDVFQTQKVEVVYGDIALIKDSFLPADFNGQLKPGQQLESVFYWRAGEYADWKFNLGWAPPHPAIFAKKSVYAKCGNFRPEFKISGDYEWMLKVFKVAKLKPHYLAEKLVYMRFGGLSDRFNFRNKLRAWRELYAAWFVNGKLAPPWLWLGRMFFDLKRIFYTFVKPLFKP